MPKFRNRAERWSWLQSHASDARYIPAGYEPEPWDVVRDDGVIVVHGVGIAAADDACRYLNSSNRKHSYEVKSACDCSPSSPQYRQTRRPTMAERPVDENTELIAEAERYDPGANRANLRYAHSLVNRLAAALAKSERELAEERAAGEKAASVIFDLAREVEAAKQKLTEQEEYWRNRMENGPWARADENLMLQAQIAEQAATIEAVKRVQRASPTQALADIHLILNHAGTTEQEDNHG